MVKSHVVLLLSWVLFSLIHHVLADSRFKARMQVIMKSRFKYYRLLYSVIAFLTLGGVLMLQLSTASVAIPLPLAVGLIIAVPAGVAGILLMQISLFKYFYRVSGVAILFPGPGLAKLETTGIHKYIRHPLYLGTLLVIWSLFLVFPSLSNMIACTAITVYVLIGLRSEEKKLLGIFGDEYHQYMARTPKLIPSVGSFAIFRQG